MHSALALVIRASSYEGAARIWLTGRQKRPGERHYFRYDDLVTFYADQAGKHPQTIKRYLDKGEGVFFTFGWHKGERIVSFNSVQVVCQYFHLEKPGRVVMVDSANILGNLRVYRATLESGFLNARESKWMSRETRQKITKAHPRTQLNYDRSLGRKIHYSYITNWQTESGERRQSVNRYFAIYQARYSGKRKIPHTSKVNGLVQNPFDVTGNKPRRLFFDNGNQAMTAAKHRTKQGEHGQLFVVLPQQSQRRNIELLAIDLDSLSC